MPVYGDDRDLVSELERAVIARLCREMESLGCEVTSLRRESGHAERWLVHWGVKDRAATLVSYGATGATAVAAVRAALSNARSDLSEPAAF